MDSRGKHQSLWESKITVIQTQLTCDEHRCGVGATRIARLRRTTDAEDQKRKMEMNQREVRDFCVIKKLTKEIKLISILCYLITN